MPCFFSSPDQLSNHLGLLGTEGGGWLIHDQDLGVEIDRPGDGDGLALTTGKRFPPAGPLNFLEVGVETTP